MEKNAEQVIQRDIFRHSLLARGEDSALTDYDVRQSYSYRELNRRADCLADYLQKRLHIKKGDRLGVCAQNCPVLFDAFFACYKTGIILTTYNGRLPINTLEQQLHNEAPSLVLFDSFNHAVMIQLEERLPNLSAMCVEEPDFTPSQTYQEILSNPAPLCQWADVDMEDICMLMHTGGTTGTPKAAMLSYRNIVFNCLSQLNTYHLTEKDCTYLTTQLFHTAAWNSLAIPVLAAGGHLIIQRKFHLSDLLKIVASERLTFLLSVPTVYQRLLNDPAFDTVDLSSLRRLRCGAAPLTRNLMEAYWKRGFTICNAYGMTEVGPANLCFPTRELTMEKLRAKTGSVGKPMMFNDVRIIRSDGTIAGDNEVGELQFRGPLVFSGYWNCCGENIFELGGWVKTGDLAQRDEDGFYYIVGRTKHMFISGGENIFPYEIENVLCTHPAVIDCCVVGVPDTEWSEVGKALVVLNGQCKVSAEELRQWCSERLTKLFVPRYFQFLEQLPRNSSGKLLYGELTRYQTAENG